MDDPTASGEVVITEPTPNDRLDLFKQMEELLQQIDTSSFALWRHVRELWAQEIDVADPPSSSGRPYERVPISPEVMAKTAAEVLLDPPPMPDLRVPDVSPEEHEAAWREWAERGLQGPIKDDSDALLALIMRNGKRFAVLARAPKYDGPREAVLGFAECAEALGGIGPAIEAYEVLLDRAREDDKPPPWVLELRAKLAALRGVP